MSLNQRFLIVGGDGLIGAALASHLTARAYAVYSTTRRAPVVERALRVDLSSLGSEPETLAALADLSAQGPLAVFIAAAMTGFELCEREPDVSQRVNVENTCLLANRLANAGAFVVFLSSNAVFSGEGEPQSESSRPDPRALYGHQKAEVEHRLLADQASTSADGGVAVVRLTKVVSAEQPLIRGWIQTLRNGEAIEAATDLRLSPISLQYTVQGLAQVAEARRRGIFHLSGAGTISYHKLACCLARRLGSSVANVRGVAIRTRLGAVPSPPVGSLDMTETKRTLGIAPQSLEAVVDDLLAT